MKNIERCNKSKTIFKIEIKIPLFGLPIKFLVKIFIENQLIITLR